MRVGEGGWEGEGRLRGGRRRVRGCKGVQGAVRGCEGVHLRLLEDEDGGGLLLVQQHRVVLPVAVGGGLKGEELGVGE